MSERQEFLAKTMRDELARQGTVWVRARGRSMAPLLVLGDRVKLEETSLSEIRRKDLVAFVGEDGVLRTHRVLRTIAGDEDESVLTKGDNERQPDPPVPAGVIVGKAVARERFGVVTPFDSVRWRAGGAVGRGLAGVRAALRPMARRRDRRRSGRTKDSLADIVAEIGRLRPELAGDAWSGLTDSDAQSLGALLRRHRLATRAAALLPEATPEWAWAVIEQEAARWRAVCVTSLEGFDAALGALDEALQTGAASRGAARQDSKEERDRSTMPAVVLKGVTYAERLYGGACARPFSDIDIAVVGTRVPECVRALESAGWRYRPRKRFKWERQLHEHDFLPADPPAYLRVELHTGLVDKPEFVPGLAADPSLMWEEVEAAEIAGRRVLVLGPEATVLHTAVHWHLHNYTSLLWGLDVALAASGRLGRIDWDKVVALARRWRVAHICWVALTLAGLEHDAPVPPATLHVLRPKDPVIRWLVRRIAGRNPVFRRERKLSLEQALIYTLRDSPWHRLGATLMLPLRVVGWEREPGSGEGARSGTG